MGKDIVAALSEIQEILEVKNSLEVRFAEEKKRRIEAEKTQLAESRGTENKMCLSGDNLCIMVPSFSGISTGILIFGLVLGLVCGCQLPSQFASRFCNLFNCCCPATAASEDPEDINVNIVIDQGDEGDQEKQALKDG